MMTKLYKYKHFKGDTYITIGDVPRVTSSVRELRSGDTCKLCYDTRKDILVVLAPDESKPQDVLISNMICATDSWSNAGYGVVYARLGDNKSPTVYCRDIDEFTSYVDTKKYPDVKAKFRFEYMSTVKTLLRNSPKAINDCYQDDAVMDTIGIAAYTKWVNSESSFSNQIKALNYKRQWDRFINYMEGCADND